MSTIPQAASLENPPAPAAPAPADPAALPPSPPGPPALRPLLVLWLGPLLAWLSAYIYQRVLARNATHPLVRLVRSEFDLAPVVAACASYYHAHGRGAPPTYSVELLVRAEIVRVWAASCSDPALERRLTNDLVARWFVGLPLLAPAPDHCTLFRFHAWLTTHAPRALFAAVLAFLDRGDPEDARSTPQLLDTFALATPAAGQGASEILRTLTRQVVDLWALLAPPDAPDPLATLDRAALTTRPPLYDAAQRLAALRQAVSLAQAVQAALLPHLERLAPPDRAAVAARLALLDKVRADDTTTDASGQVSERPAGQKGAYRLGSATDPQATFRKHGDDPAVLGYNAAIATTGTRIRAALVLPGSTPDSEAPVALLTQQAAAGLPRPADVVMDQAGGQGKTRAQVVSASGGQTQMVARTPAGGGSDPTRYGPSAFTVSADGQECTCPNGVVSRKPYPSGEGDGVHFRFTAKQCAGCPLRERCRDPQANPAGHRTVYISPYSGHLAVAAVFNRTERGKELLGQRWAVEPTIAWLVRYEGCRVARRVGQAAAQLHLYQACAVRNLWRWLGRVARRGAAAAGATR